MKNPALIRLVIIILFCHSNIGAIAQSISGVINSYYSITSINTTTNTLTVTSPGGLAPGTKVLIIQMKGAVINNTNTASFGDITNIDEAGNYEYNYVCAVAGNDVLMRHPLIHTYNILGKVQLITVPQYNIITVAGPITANPWDGVVGTGGVVVFEADTIYLNSDITVSGQGFAGGGFVNFTTPTYDCSWATTVSNYFLQLSPVPDQYYSGGPKGEGIAAFITNAEYGKGKQANGGGGGNNHNTGGAGGANYGGGGNGGRRTNESFFLCHGAHPGIGGLAVSSFGYTASTNRIFMGGGGGSSHQNNSKGTPGGNGGGMVLITANIIIGTTTTIYADGLSPVNVTNIDPYTAEGDGGGGGGAGGSIILNVNQVIGSVGTSAVGARGSDASRGVNDCTGPGGGGGGGIVWMKGPVFSPNVTAVITGGGNGVVSMFSSIAACRGQANGSTPGGGGSTLSDYVAPSMGSSICSPLPVPELKFFKGRGEQKNIALWWTMNHIDKIRAYEVERSVDQVRFLTLGHLTNNGSYSLTFTDKDQLTGTQFYRLKLLRTNGTSGYSPIIPITRTIDGLLGPLTIFPNPVNDHLKVTGFSKKAAKIKIQVYNAEGQCVFQDHYQVTPGYIMLTIPATQFSPGIYWLMLEANGTRERKRFIKMP